MWVLMRLIWHILILNNYNFSWNNLWSKFIDLFTWNVIFVLSSFIKNTFNKHLCPLHKVRLLFFVSLIFCLYFLIPHCLNHMCFKVSFHNTMGFESLLGYYPLKYCFSFSLKKPVNGSRLNLESLHLSLKKATTIKTFRLL